MEGPERVAIIGGGMSGLSCARSLASSGIAATVFDKGYGPGGRVASRRAAEASVDYGAQYLTVHEKGFRSQVSEWLETGVLAEWPGRIVRIAADGSIDAARAARRYVGTPTMRSLTEHMAAGCDVRTQTRIDSLERRAGRWYVVDEEGREAGDFDAVIVATPAPQAVPLIAAAPEFRALAEMTRLEPCWTVMAVFDEPVALPYDAAFIESSALAWVAHDSSKPGRAHTGAWVLHASPAWSQEHLEDDPDDVAERLLIHFGALFPGPAPRPRFVAAHRWRYAQAAQPFWGSSFYLAEVGLGACGDWWRGRRIEDAFVSGTDVASRVMAAKREYSSVRP